MIKEPFTFDNFENFPTLGPTPEERNHRKRVCQEKLQHLDQYVERLAAVIEKGQVLEDDDFKIKEFLLLTLESALNIKMVGDAISSFEYDIRIIEDTILLVDVSMNLNDKIHQMMNTQAKGFLARIRRNNHLRQIIRFHLDRMEQLVDYIRIGMEKQDSTKEELANLLKKIRMRKKRKGTIPYDMCEFPLTSQYLSEQKSDDAHSNGEAGDTTSTSAPTGAPPTATPSDTPDSII